MTLPPTAHMQCVFQLFHGHWKIPINKIPDIVKLPTLLVVFFYHYITLSNFLIKSWKISKILNYGKSYKELQLSKKMHQILDPRISSINVKRFLTEKWILLFQFKLLNKNPSIWNWRNVPCFCYFIKIAFIHIRKFVWEFCLIQKNVQLMKSKNFCTGTVFWILKSRNRITKNLITEWKYAARYSDLMIVTLAVRIIFRNVNCIFTGKYFWLLTTVYIQWTLSSFSYFYLTID